MADVTSSDGHCGTRLHTAWASVLIWTDLTGSRTVLRNGVVIGSIPAGGIVYYDHYPPLGANASYQVSNGSTTSTTAVQPIPAATYRSTWVKSTVDPNLSTQVSESEFAPYSYEQAIGEHRIAGGGWFTIYGTPALRSGSLSCYVTTNTARDKLVAAMQAGLVCVQRHPAAQEPDMFCSAKQPKVTRVGKLGAGGSWIVAADVREQTVASLPGTIIPGWGWDNVKTTWATWNALKAANATWLDLVKYGVS